MPKYRVARVDHAHLGLYTVHGDRVYMPADSGRHVGLLGLQAVDVVAFYRCIH